MDIDQCPICTVSWVGEEIPEKSRYLYNGKTHFKREIGIYDLEKDMTVKWRCPDCGSTFDRFTLELVHDGRKGEA